MKDYVLTLLAATSSTGVLGSVTCTEATKAFDEYIQHKPVIMGRHTFEARGGEHIPNCKTIVVSNTLKGLPPRVTVVRSVEAAIALAKRNNYGNLRNIKKEIVVIGGRSLFTSTIEIADYIRLFVINTHTEGETHFPAIDAKDWLLLEEELLSSSGTGVVYRRLKYKRQPLSYAS